MFSFKNIFTKIKVKAFLTTTIKQLECINYNNQKNSTSLHIITVTFNNELLLQPQINLIKKNIIDSCEFIVADNSSNINKRKLISEICKKNNVTYIPLPNNPYKIGSNSHAICLNWMFKNYIQIKNPLYFGFIDHDIFPIMPHSIISYLDKQPIYGHWQGNKNYWYLWAGFCFFKYEKIKNKKINFSTTIINNNQVDTGGANYNSIYKDLDINKLNFPDSKYINLRENGESLQSNTIQLIGNWLHSFNGSYWMEMAPKEQLLYDYLKKYY